MKPMHKVIAFQIDPLESLNIETDSSLLLAIEMQNRGYEIFFYQVKDLYIENNEVFAKGFFAHLEKDSKSYYSITNHAVLNLAEVLLIMIRQDPPFDMNYITSTYILDKLGAHTPVFNNPSSIRNLPEKFSPLIFKNFLPEFIISSDLHLIEHFIQRHNFAVLKPLYQHGGKNIVLTNVDEENFQATIKNHIEKFGHIVVQQFIPSVRNNGDKRVIFSAGKLIGFFQRLPKSGDFRSNAALGGSFAKCELTIKEQLLCKKIGKFLEKNSIIFAGIDILGEKLIEINITSPTGLAILNKLYGGLHEKLVVNTIETKVNYWYKAKK
ncbi:MAG: glutathione synthase [Candidatus Midichloria mitochondrii]|uniref:Glutathione synthetase n=2 Tax=Candidatus Midichloria mitochondrii TaxID=234827 RepID=F7XV13_MIDMI|nr:glutathione synthetase [Candidatus Midichloria mitochondrii IricVA]MDJ1256366.1 glutathione synthase [Candidatus Midichloria mitochondrii]MDJ1288031.1 glutathione synthase [Candidatus Midichloria mitochondrii]MDJ1298921.1 glutathione synthase [Candidatus Midichloria mitochondrii]MDJ1313084.1 glutathione synthase [Candidatus Midichloria mitochondrii]